MDPKINRWTGKPYENKRARDRLIRQTVRNVKNQERVKP